MEQVRSGLDLAQLDRLACRLMADRKGHVEREIGYIYHHGVRTATLSVELSVRIDERLDTSRDILYAGALFHDVAKGLEPHAGMGASIVREALEGVIPTDEVEQIAAIVRDHNSRGRGGDVSARIVQDADLLDHFGTQNVWLCFHHSAAHDSPGEEAVEYYRSEDNQRYIRWCREIMNFDASRAVLEDRLAVERRFFDRFERELRGDLD